MPKKVIDKMKNPYEAKSMQKFLPKKANRSKHLHQMEPCFRSIVCGSTGSGKTAYISNLLERYKNHFNSITIFTAEQEGLYSWMQSQIDDSMFRIYYNDLSPLVENDLNDFFWGSSLVIIDDMITKNKKELKPVMDLFIRGRKIHNGVSICFLTQSFFDCPLLIRKQLSYCVLVKINGKNDLKRILSDFNLNCDINQLVKMYEYCCLNNFGDVLTLDKISPQNSGKSFRKNFLEFLDPKVFNY